MPALPTAMMHSGTAPSSSSSADNKPSSTSPSSSHDDHHPLLQRDHILTDILTHIDAFLAAHHLDDARVVDTAPLKDQVLRPVLARDFDPEVQIRGFLRALRRTPAFVAALAAIADPTLRARVDAFVQGKSVKDVLGGAKFAMPGSGRHGAAAAEAEGGVGEVVKEGFVDALKRVVFKVLAARKLFTRCFGEGAKGEEPVKPGDLPKVFEDEAKTKVMEVHFRAPFSNWGETVNHKPRYTFLPTTVLGVQNLVRYAAANKLRVRCAGYRHSWSPIFSQEDNILVSFVNLEQVTTLPDPMSLEPGDYTGIGVGELKTIELKEQLGATKRLCRIGAGVTNEDFRRWAVANNAWALPVDVILVEVTIGGVNGPICHGAGRRHPTCSDGVRRIEYVDCNGGVQVVDDARLIKAAAGGFGLLGVVTHITFELDKMTYAVMEPRKIDVGLAIPPLKKDDIPLALRADWFDAADAEKQMEAARLDFERRAAEDYYSEWFWFTYQQKAWVNTWNAVEEATDVVDYPDDADTFLQWIEGWLGGILTSSKLFNALPGHWQAQLLATSGMAALPPRFGENDTPTIKTHLTNALHFRRGIQNMRVRDTEFQIPIPPLHPGDPSSAPDFSVVQRAWWDVIALVYSYADGSAPMRLTLELRIMGGSDMLLAPQRGNAPWGTASIEVLSVPDAVADKEWQGFMQKVAERWMSYEYAVGEGGVKEKLNVRPHWAKEWEGLTLGGVDARRYLKDVAYRDQIPAFRQALAEIGSAQGWGLADLKARFSNELWDELVFDKE